MRYLYSILLCFIASVGLGQLQTNGGMSASQLVQNVLLGQGVDVSNINYYGSLNAIGTFDATNTTLGIDKGIIMNTGTIHNVPGGPFGPNNLENAGIDNGTPGYAPLSNIVGASTFNATLLEFDFIPYSDTVKFKYIFASEEYPEYVGSQFNDVFAFFISGPGIPGGSKNMAIIPGTSQPVTINTVNSGSNAMYYHPNGNGNMSPYNQNPKYIQYDGYTTPLEAVSKVICGEKYHLVIALADVSDAIWDSAIFLEKNSLSSNQPVQVSYQLTSDPFGDGATMAQNCTSAIVTVSRSGGNINQPLDIPLSVSGNAVEGVDFSSLPSSVHFAPGQTVVTFTVDALNNQNLTGTVHLTLHFSITNACGDDNSQEIDLYIKPIAPVTVSVEDEELDCPGQEVNLIAQPLGGGGGYSIIWSTGDTTTSIAVSPPNTTTYYVSVVDGCLGDTAKDSATVTVPNFGPLEVSASDDTTVLCPYTPLTIGAEVTGGSGEYAYRWANNSNSSLGTLPTLDVSPYSTTSYTIYVTDLCGHVDSDKVVITVNSPPLTLDITPLSKICPGDSLLLEVFPTGGHGNYHYFWPHLGDTTKTVWVHPDTTTTYYVIVRDDCQTFQVNNHTTVEVVHPTADFEILNPPWYKGFPVNFKNTSQGADLSSWSFGDGGTSTMTFPTHIYSDTGEYNVLLVVTGRLGCKDSVVRTLRILKQVNLFIPNSFTPNGDEYNNVFMVRAVGLKTFKMRIFNRWGELIFTSEDINRGWNGAYGKYNELVPIGTYVWKIDYTTVNTDEVQHLVGHVNVLR